MKLEHSMQLRLEGKLALHKVLQFKLPKYDLLYHLGVVTFKIIY